MFKVLAILVSVFFLISKKGKSIISNINSAVLRTVIYILLGILSVYSVVTLIGILLSNIKIFIVILIVGLILIFVLRKDTTTKKVNIAQEKKEVKIVDKRIKFVFPLNEKWHTIFIEDAKSVPKDTQVLVIPEGYRMIEKGAFSKFNFEEVVLPNSIVAIECGAFSECHNLKKINLPNKLLHIKDKCFYDCDNLKEISIPNSVTDISDRAFYKCSSLQSITFPESIKTIGDSAFALSGITNVIIPKSVNTIKSNAFYECEKLEKVVINGDISVGNSSFAMCKSLKSVEFNGQVLSIEPYAFCECSSLVEMKFSHIPPKMHYTVFENSSYNIKKHYRKCKIWGKKRVMAKAMAINICCKFIDIFCDSASENLSLAKQIVNNPSEYTAEQVKKAQDFIEKLERGGGCDNE